MGCEHSTPVPPSYAYDTIHPTTGPYLGDGTPAIPSKNNRPIRIVMKERAFSSWSGDSFKIRTEQNLPFAGGFDIKGRMFSNRGKLILRDGQGRPVAICLQQFHHFRPTFRIYSFHPIVPKQQPSRNQSHEGRRLYKWAECKDFVGSVRYKMSLWNGTEFVPEYQTNNVGAVIGPQTICVTRRGRNCVKMQQTNNELFRGQVWRVTIAPGIDPCLIICFIAIVDEMKEQ